MIPGTIGLDIFSELDRVTGSAKICVLDKTVTELDVLFEREKGQIKKAAKLAKSMIVAKKIKVITTKSKKYVDDLLVDLKDEYIIATQDKELKKQLKRVIILRSKTHLEMIEI